MHLTSRRSVCVTWLAVYGVRGSLLTVLTLQQWWTASLTSVVNDYPRLRPTHVKYIANQSATNQVRLLLHCRMSHHEGLEIEVRHRSVRALRTRPRVRMKGCDRLQPNVEKILCTRARRCRLAADRQHRCALDTQIKRPVATRHSRVISREPHSVSL